MALLLLSWPLPAQAQSTAANPSAAASDIRSPSSINPAARASDIRNPSATNPAAAASDLRATAVPVQGASPGVVRRQTFAPPIIRRERRARTVKRAPARKGAVREAARPTTRAKAAPPTEAQQRAERKAGAIMGSVCRGC
jgi:hypothetical protein